MSSDPTPYDDVAYRGYVHDGTHPARLATMAALYGMSPRPPSRCRLLELGCGNGANIIAMAAQYPNSEFVGIDLSGRSIQAGRNVVGELGLNNIVLHHVSITNVTADYGLCDYITAHGVYSWVPPAVREKMLAIYRDNLAPQGVGYVSYNALPGSYLRDTVRDMMFFHARDIADPADKIEQARAVVQLIAEASKKDSVHGQVLRDQVSRIERMGDDILFHDDLNEGAKAFLLHEVVAEAERHGLQYLSDCSLWRRSLENVPDNMKTLLSQFPAAAYMERDQYHDFIGGHSFRRTLLCHREIKLDRDVTPDRIKGFCLASSLAPTAPDVDPIAAGATEFKTKLNERFATSHLLTKAALMHLGEIWPATVAMDELLSAARHRLDSRGVTPDAGSGKEVATLTRALVDAVCGGHIELHLYPLDCVSTISERPLASRLARMQLKNGPLVTTLRHESIAIENELMRAFVCLLDGTRDFDRLMVDFASVVARSDPVTRRKPVTPDVIEHNLNMAAKLALLVG